jgi:S-DNA-T family DNA segregation ATPase FtsK/SpoIIIE
VVGIEIPSPHRELVCFKNLVQETPFYKDELKIPIVLGRLASGEPVVSDLASMPHLLIAGTTGTGKSVFVNTLICRLLFRFTQRELKLVLVDPKMVELSHYEGIPHLLLPVVVDSKKAALALRWAVDEMERRYTLMHRFGVRHIDAYNERLFEEQPFLPYIVVVIDEYADLMAVVPKAVELSIARLAQKARASGIHLVLATQRPSTDVVTGTIKANFQSRISFRVASSVDSKTILDRTGADRLLGNGDLLFHSAGFTTLKRMQGPFLSDTDMEAIVAYLKTQGEPEYDEHILRDPDDENPILDVGEESEDALYQSAVQLVTDKGEASISLIQRHLKIGYNRAATLMEQLETAGIVGQSAGPAKRRSVLLNQP